MFEGISKDFGVRLKSLREERGWTQAQLCQILNSRFGSNINNAMLSKWENGKDSPRMDNVRRLIEVFDVSLGFLLGLEEDEPVASSDEDVQDMLEYLHKRPEAKALLSKSEKLTKEQLESVIALIDSIHNE